MPTLDWSVGVAFDGLCDSVGKRCADNRHGQDIDAFEEVTGYPPAETLGRNCRLVQDEDTDPEKITALREAIAARDPVTAELRSYRKDQYLTKFGTDTAPQPQMNAATGVPER